MPHALQRAWGVHRCCLPACLPACLSAYRLDFEPFAQVVIHNGEEDDAFLVCTAEGVVLENFTLLQLGGYDGTLQVGLTVRPALPPKRVAQAEPVRSYCSSSSFAAHPACREGGWLEGGPVIPPLGAP